MTTLDVHITVATMVEQDNRFLIVRESVGDRIVLNQPAGHVEPGESLVAAACRETLEETAWQIRVTALLGVYLFQPVAAGRTYYRFCFVGEPLQACKDRALDEGIIEALWLDPLTLTERACEHRSPLVARCLQDYLSGRRLPLDTLYEHPAPAGNL